MKTFEESSYRSQVLKLRKLAKVALTLYDVKIEKLQFINHAENATFCVHSRNGRKYLLRILRGGYHTDRAAESELKWLRHLSNNGFAVPKPVFSRARKLLCSALTREMPTGRNCALFEWVEGRFISKSISRKHMYEVGRLIARLQQNAPASLARHRRYWDAEGMVGTKPKFGSVTALNGVPVETQRIISRVRPIIFSKLRSFERRFPKRLGFIHADLHFGNVLLHKGKITAIDFDDSGFGFYVYDLAVPYLAVEYNIGKKRKKELPGLREELIRGYKDHAPWDAHDEKILPHLCAARRVAMLGWFNSRSDNPRLKKRLKKSAKFVAKFVEAQYL